MDAMLHVPADSNRRSRRYGRITAAVVWLLAAAACSAGGNSSVDDTDAAPVTTDPPATTRPTEDEPAADILLPPLSTDAATVRTWLDEWGGQFARVREHSTEVLAGSAGASRCRSSIDDLAAGPTPEELANVAAQAPDSVLGDAIAGVIVDLNRVLSACAASDGPSADALDSLAANMQILDQREAQL